MDWLNFNFFMFLLMWIIGFFQGIAAYRCLEKLIEKKLGMDERNDH